MMGTCWHCPICRCYSDLLVSVAWNQLFSQSDALRWSLNLLLYITKTWLSCTHQALSSSLIFTRNPMSLVVGLNFKGQCPLQSREQRTSFWFWFSTHMVPLIKRFPLLPALDPPLVSCLTCFFDFQSLTQALRPCSPFCTGKCYVFFTTCFLIFQFRSVWPRYQEVFSFALPSLLLFNPWFPFPLSWTLVVSLEANFNLCHH